MSKEPIKLALEALGYVLTSHGGTRAHVWDSDEARFVVQTYKALEEALAKQEQGEPVAWDENEPAFDAWWNGEYDDSTNPYRKYSPAYWAWAGWKAAQPKREPKKCGLCGEDRAFTGTCGGGRDKPNALCYEVPQPAHQKAEKQEPVAWVHAGSFDAMIEAGAGYCHIYPSKQIGASKPLYTHPQPKAEPVIKEVVVNADYREMWAEQVRLNQQLCAQISQPKAEQDLAYREAARLAEWLFKKHYAHEEHYASGRVVWGLCDSTAGVISQIDNMVCQLVREQDKFCDNNCVWTDHHPDCVRAEKQEQSTECVGEPVAYKPDRSGKFFTVVYEDIQAGDEARSIARHPKVSALSWSHAIRDVEYLKSNPQPVSTDKPKPSPLTDNEICNMVARISDVRNPYLQFARAIEAAHGIKEKNT